MKLDPKPMKFKVIAEGRPVQNVPTPHRLNWCLILQDGVKNLKFGFRLYQYSDDSAMRIRVYFRAKCLKFVLWGSEAPTVTEAGGELRDRALFPQLDHDRGVPMPAERRIG